MLHLHTDIIMHVNNIYLQVVYCNRAVRYSSTQRSFLTTLEIPLFGLFDMGLGDGPFGKSTKKCSFS